MTAEGERALERAEEKLETLEEDVIGHLTPAERATLAELLSKALGCDGPGAEGC
ncbi:MAG TPA: hypothetical protein VKA88_06590 [Solirubrobacterales bacterium]|nr:hypothetical protein [Solirubrobacterales bacterium]